MQGYTQVQMDLQATAAIVGCTTIACESQVAELYPTSQSGGVVLVKLQLAQTSLNCTQLGGAYLTLKPSNAVFREMFAVLLMSMQNQAPVMVRIVEGSPDCEITYVRAYGG